MNYRKSFVSFASICACAISAATPSYSLEGADRDRIKSYRYDELDLTGENAKRVIAYNIAIIGYCERNTGLKSEVRSQLQKLSAGLTDRETEITKKLEEIGNAGQLGDSMGGVPTAPMKDIAEIKGVDEAKLCRYYANALGREVTRYTQKCKINQYHLSFICNN